MKLTAEQKAAIERTGQDVCVIAGPGSGKTRVLAERFAWLVSKMGVSPRNILALTFTDKAASELLHRISKTKHAEIDFAPILTFHSLCTKILKEFSIAAGLDPATELWDERIASAELYQCVEEVLNEAARMETAAVRRLFTTWNTNTIVDDLCRLYGKIRSLSEHFPQQEGPVDLPNVLGEFVEAGEEVVRAKATTAASQTFYDSFVEWLSEFRALGMEPRWEHVTLLGNMPKRGNLPKGLKEPAAALYDVVETIQATFVSALVGPERNYLIGLLGRIAERFEVRKRAAARMDFHDLEHRTIALLRGNTKIREELQRRFEHILMDEMQDTNPIQWQLIDLLRSPGTFFGVGDVNQSIYGFRFAAPTEFIAYRESIEQGGGVIDYLGRNFRSRAEILEFTGRVSEGLAGIERPGLEAGRKFVTENLPVSLHAFGADPEEFGWIAAEIEQLRETFVVEQKADGALRRLGLRDVAILVRTSAKAEAIGGVLAERGIPFTLGGGKKFFETQETADCISYLELLANPLNTIARAAVLRSPLVGLTDGQLLSGEVDAAFESRLEGQRARVDSISPDRLLLEALDASCYVAGLNPSAKANVDKLLRICRELWRQGPMNLREFADELQKMRLAAQETSATVAGMGDAVQILTVHASKGLEFPVVFVAGAYFSSPGNRATLQFAKPDRVGVRWTNPITGKSTPDMQARVIEADSKVEEDRELQRQLYVALTRAEQRLYVSWVGEQKRGWLKYLEPHQDVRYFEGESVALPEGTALECAASVVIAPVGWVPVEISSTTPTAIAKFAQCPRRFFLDEMAGIVYRGAEAGGGAAALGTMVHAVLAGGEVEGVTAEAMELVEVFRASDVAREVDAAVWVEREFDVVFAIDGLVVQGQIDLVYEDASGDVHVVDYKTDRVISNHYGVQMAIYREAVGRLCPGKRVRSSLLYLRSNELVEVTAPLDREMFKDFQRGENYSIREGGHCQRCPHVGRACPVAG